MKKSSDEEESPIAIEEVGQPSGSGDPLPIDYEAHLPSPKPQPGQALPTAEEVNNYQYPFRAPQLIEAIYPRPKMELAYYMGRAYNKAKYGSDSANGSQQNHLFSNDVRLNQQLLPPGPPTAEPYAPDFIDQISYLPIEDSFNQLIFHDGPKGPLILGPYESGQPILEPYERDVSGQVSHPIIDSFNRLKFNDRPEGPLILGPYESATTSRPDDHYSYPFMESLDQLLSDDDDHYPYPFMESLDQLLSDDGPQGPPILGPYESAAPAPPDEFRSPISFPFTSSLDELQFDGQFNAADFLPLDLLRELGLDGFSVLPDQFGLDLDNDPTYVPTAADAAQQTQHVLQRGPLIVGPNVSASAVPPGFRSPNNNQQKDDCQSNGLDDTAGHTNNDQAAPSPSHYHQP